MVGIVGIPASSFRQCSISPIIRHRLTESSLFTERPSRSLGTRRYLKEHHVEQDTLHVATREG
jgi:hypothetical protein